jgi:hypothetical protein
MVVAMVPDTVLEVDKEIAAVAENGNQQTEILETETEMKIEIGHATYVIVKEQNRMLVDLATVQFYPMLTMSN